jgi:hypothetical protein
MKKQNDRQSSGTKSESPIFKEAAATSRQVRADTGEGSTSSDGAHELIRARAYRLFELRGWQPGHALDDWLQAEREVLRPLPPPQNRGIACSC